MLGPLDFGSTADVRGIWQIVQKMHVLMTWVGTDYRKWFDDNVIKKAKAESAGPTDTNAAVPGEEDD